MKKNILMTIVLILVLAIFGLSFVLLGSLKPKLKSLKNDPFVSVTHNNTELIKQYEFPEGETFGKPSYATISKNFRIINQEEAEQVFKKALESAENYGWKRDTEWKGGEFSMRFVKVMETGRADLIILLTEGSLMNNDGKRALQMSFTHR